MITGFIESLGQKDLPFGTIHNLTVNGQLYDIGKFPLKGFNVGDYVQFAATNKPGTPYWKLTLGTVSKLPPPAGIAAPPAAPAPSAAPPAATGGFAGGKTSATQDIISRQAAANTAIAYLKVLVDADALPMPKTAAKDKKVDLMEAILTDLMDKFHTWSTHKPFDFGEPVAKTLEGLEIANPADEDWNE